MDGGGGRIHVNKAVLLFKYGTEIFYSKTFKKERKLYANISTSEKGGENVYVTKFSKTRSRNMSVMQ